MDMAFSLSKNCKQAVIADDTSKSIEHVCSVPWYTVEQPKMWATPGIPLRTNRINVEHTTGDFF